MLNLLLITICIVFIVDLSGYADTLKRWISYWLTKGKIQTSNYSLKPFTCSLCLTFWVGLAYLLITHQLCLPLFMGVCLLAFITPTIKDILLFMRDLLTKGIRVLYKILDL